MLSIITITRNDIDGCRKTIDSTSILRSTIEEIEQVVIDGSDEDQHRIVESYCRDKPKVRYFRKAPEGISDAFNYGIANSKNELLWFLNGGDEVYRNLDVSLFAALLKNVSPDLLICEIELKQSKRIVSFPAINSCFPPVKTWIPHPATIINRRVFDRYGLFDSRFKIAMDYEFWNRIYQRNLRVNMLSLPIASYDENGLSSTQTSAVFKEGLIIMQQYKRKLLSDWLRSGRLVLKQYRFFKTQV